MSNYDDTSPLLASLVDQIKALKQPTDVFTNPVSAAQYQAVIAQLESNDDPNAPGLAQIFKLANDAILVQRKAIESVDLPTVDQVSNLSVPLHDAWAAWLMEQYLLRLSVQMGYSAPAQKFLAANVPEVNKRPNPLPYPISTPPTPTPTPSPTPTPVIINVPVPSPIPSPSPVPSPSPGPSPTPSPGTGPSVQFVAADQDLYPGSGEPSNATTLKNSLGVNAVYLPVHAYTNDKNATNATWLNSDNNPVLVGGTIDNVVATYKNSGLDVILALVLDCADGTARQDFRPSDTQRFLVNLTTLAKQLATAAKRLNVSAISIAPGIFPYSGNGDAPANYMGQWRNIYQTCKSIFSGPVLYQATPATVGPKGATTAMDWGTGNNYVWDAIGIEISAPYGGNTSTSSIENYWETATDAESPYNAPLFGANGWLRQVYNEWSSTGRKLWVTTTGITAAGNVPAPIPVAPVPTVTPPTPSPQPAPSPGPAPSPSPSPSPTPGPAPSPVPAPVHQLTSGYMHTSGGQILDINNTPVRICATVWEGMHLRHGFPRGLDQISYKTTLADMGRLGFNAVKILLNDASVLNDDTVTGINTTANPDLANLAYLEILDKIVNYAGSIGMRVILESHSSEGIAFASGGAYASQANGLWYSSGGASDNTDGSGNTGTVTAASFQNMWSQLASRYKGNQAILGYDLRYAPISLYQESYAPLNTGTVNNATTSSADLTFSVPPPLTGKGQEVQYQVFYRRLCDLTWSSTTPTSSTSDKVTITLSGLAANTVYAYYATADGGRYSQWQTFATANGGSSDSADGWMVFSVNQGISLSGHTWTLNTSTTTPFQVTVDGAADASTSNVIMLVKSGGKVYKLNHDQTWSYKTLPTDSWTSASSPRGGDRTATLPTYTIASSSINNTRLSYNGGPVLDGPQVTLVFSGTSWQTSTSPSSSDIQNAMKNLFAGSYFSGLQEYGITHKPQIIRSIVDTVDLGSFASMTDSQAISAVMNETTRLFDTGTLPVPQTDNHLFVFYIPQSSGHPSNSAGSHSMMLYHGAPIHVAYAAYEDLTSQGFATPLDSYTAISTHEIVEAMTDPGAGSGQQLNGWTGVDSALSLPIIEVEDITVNLNAINSNGVNVWPYWSNTANAAIYTTADDSSISPNPVPLGSFAGVTWGDNYAPTDLLEMYQNVGNQIQRIDSGPLIICEAPRNNKLGAYEGDLRMIRTYPVTLMTANKVVYGVTSFPAEVSSLSLTTDNGSAYISRSNDTWGYLVGNRIAPVMVVAAGDDMTSTDAQTWGDTFTAYLNGTATNGIRYNAGDEPMSFGWCYWGPTHNTTPDYATTNGWANPALTNAASKYLNQLAPQVITGTSPTPPPAPPPAPTPSADNTIIPPATQIIGSDLTIWTLANSQVVVNGTPDTTTKNVVEMAYESTKVWYKTSGGLWYYKIKASDASWLPQGGTTVDPTVQTSASGTTVPPATQIVDASKNIWTINGSAQVAENGVADTNTANVAELAYVNGVVWQYVQSLNLWWYWDTASSSWLPAGGTAQSPLAGSSPPPSPSPAPPPSPSPSPGPSPIPVPTPAGTAATFDFSHATGAKVSPLLYGVACGEFTAGPPYNYSTMTDTEFQNLMSGLHIGSLRLNWSQNPGIIDSIFPTQGATADFSYLDNYVQNIKKCFALGTTLQTANVILTIGYPQWLNAGDAASLAAYQDCCRQIAQYYLNNGCPIYYWDFANEDDGTDINTCVTIFNSMKAGVQSVDPTYKVGGLSDSYENWARLPTFIQQCKPDFLSWHDYNEEAGSKSDAQVFIDSTGTGADGTISRSNANSYGFPSSNPIFVTEFNMDGTPDYTPQQQDVTGAVYYAFRAAQFANAGQVAALHRWDIVFDSYYGMIYGTGSNYPLYKPYAVAPSGYLVQHVAPIATGNVISSSLSGFATSPNILLFGSVNGSHGQAQIINYDQSGTAYKLGIAMTNTPTTAFTYFEISAAHPSGYTTSISSSALQAGITIPANSVVVISY